MRFFELFFAHAALLGTAAHALLLANDVFDAFKNLFGFFPLPTQFSLGIPIESLDQARQIFGQIFVAIDKALQFIGAFKQFLLAQILQYIFEFRVC